MDALLLDTITTVATVGACSLVALAGVLALPWSDAEVAESADAWRALGALPLQAVRALRDRRPVVALPVDSVRAR